MEANFLFWSTLFPMTWAMIICVTLFPFQSVHFSSVAQLCLTLCDAMDHSMPGLPVHQFQESTQTHLHWVGDAIQPSHPLSSPSPPAFSLFQHHGLFQWVSSSHQVAQVLEFQLQHQSFQWTPRRHIFFRMDWLDLLAVQGTLKSLLQHHSSKASILWCLAFFMVAFAGHLRDFYEYFGHSRHHLPTIQEMTLHVDITR